MTDIRWTPIHVYLDRQPTFKELGEQAWQLALHQHFADDTWWDRLVFAQESLRLRAASRLAKLVPLTFPKYYGQQVLLRVVPTVALGFLVLYARDAFRRGLFGNGAPISQFAILLAASFVLGSAWGLWRWQKAHKTLAWAETYRAEFLNRQEQLLSPAGWHGWRLVPKEAGYVFVPVDDGHGGV